MPVVRIKSGEGAGTEFELGEAPLVVGRDDRAEIQIVDQGVSRRHAEFFRIGEMYFLRDLDSRNGTFVNEERVKEELLRDGDEVRIASTVLTFEGGGHASRGAAAREPRAEQVRARLAGAERLVPLGPKVASCRRVGAVLRLPVPAGLVRRPVSREIVRYVAARTIGN